MPDQATTTYYAPTEAEQAESRRQTALYQAAQLSNLYTTQEEFITLAKKIESYLKDGN